jgi:hypothetical protein
MIYKMSFSDQILILGFILLLVVLFSLGSSGVVAPYSSDTLFPKYYPYEGFEADASKEKSALSPSSLPSDIEKNMMSIMPPKVPGDASSTDAGTQLTDKKKVEGFSGLQGSTYGVEPSLDIFSQQKSGGTCAPSPYSNSMGYLCLDQNATAMLNTRGGNATGKDAQYGSPASK